MYLQSLEMVGFKSFAPKTVLNFNEGVTAVVGPNGCGKSNVLDALRWVLGEQSARALRGGEMADVIFSGTDSRPALGMAEVSLTFTDCEKELGVEWNEVRITRRVFRDGKSEYLLNKAPCRLRDIHQLFMDTGIGRSAYSIMEQGKIDAILSSRPEDRRAIFEEAAGITKYKAQKKEALRKLEYTEANLLRVTDIIKEVKRQIGSLQRQAAKARRYQALMEDLRTFDTHLSHRNYAALKTELVSIREELERGESTRQLHEAEIEAQESEAGELRQRLAEYEQQAADVRDNIQTQRSRIHAAENRIATNAERCEESRGLIERSRLEIAAGEEKLQEQENQIARTDEMIAVMLETLRTGEAQLTEATDRVNLARESRVSVERQAQGLAAEVAQLENRLSALRTEVSAAGGRREAGQARLQILQAEEASAAEACELLRARAAEGRRRLDEAVSGLESAQIEMDEAQADHDAAQRARQEADSGVNAANRLLAEQESRLEVLRQLVAEGEGLGEGTQAVLRGLDNPDFFKPAVDGALAAFISVDAQYIPAVEAALGANLQAVVFKDPSVAEAAMLTLAGRKLGRAAIIPRDWVRETAEVQEMGLPEGSLAWAADCVRATADAGRLARQLLAGVAVVDGIERAFALKSQYPRLGFATLGGEFISREGIVQGGRNGENATSVLARKNQIAALERDVASSQAAVAERTAQREAAMTALDAAQDRLQGAREAVQAAQIEQSTARSECELVERQEREAESRRGNFAREAAQLEAGVAESAEKVLSLEQRIAECEETLLATRGRGSELQARIEEARDRERLAADDLNELRVRVATERQQQENLTRQRGPMAARVAELTELLGQRARDIDGFESRIGSLEAESVELRESIGNWQMILETGEQQIGGILAQRGEAQESLEALEVALRVSRRTLAELQESRGRQEVLGTQLELRMEHIGEHVAHRYQVNLEEFRPDSYSLIKAFREREGKAKKGFDAETEGRGDAESVENAEVSGEESEGEFDAAVERREGAGSDEGEREEGIPWERIEVLVSELTAKVDGMGPVNLDAIQEYEELEERHNFLEQQNTDLVNSKEELLDVIAKINVTTKELFAETFEKIRVNFQEMFGELFGGGKANLILTDESDPLESGIEIIAKPPGKQLQSISLLSGGEKTMTAVALLFSIYMVKPSPFCVLDEMDAPLDESNISRFIKILDRFVGQSQFVVITHNKRTISRADMVFGVTMEEHGVSKLVSVKFHGREETPDEDANGNPRSVAEVFGKHGNLHSEGQQEDVALVR